MLDTEAIKRLIPQRPPFLMLDRVVELKAHESITAYKNVSIDEDYFRGHFPTVPVFPGALTAEGMAQAACVLFRISRPEVAATVFFVTNVKIRFFRPVVPGDRLVMRVRSVKMTSIGGVFETDARVGDAVVAKGEMTFACK